MSRFVSIIIPTYKRGSTLKFVLKGLKEQTYRNFEIVLVFKPSGDQTEEIVKEYGKDLKIRVIVQKEGFVTDAYNLGLQKAGGQIVAFLDDDAVPCPDWLEQHLRIHDRHVEVGGVSGIAVSAIKKNEKIIQIHDKLGSQSSFRRAYYALPWARPLSGMSGYLIFFGRDGLVHHSSQLENKDVHSIVPSLLHMGANMSVKKEAIVGLRINDNLILGFTFEQLLSYHIWKRGYRLLYYPDAKVLHMLHRESAGRFFQSYNRATLRDAEFVLTFAFLKSQEPEISWLSYILSISALILRRMMRANEHGLLISLYRVRGLLHGFVIASAYLISEGMNRCFSIRASLSKLL